MLNEVKELTENNNHSECLLIGADYLLQADVNNLGAKRFVKEFTEIFDEHLKVGYLTPELSSRRKKLYKEFKFLARQILTEVEYKLFNDCF